MKKIVYRIFGVLFLVFGLLMLMIGHSFSAVVFIILGVLYSFGFPRSKQKATPMEESAKEESPQRVSPFPPGESEKEALPQRITTLSRLPKTVSQCRLAYKYTFPVVPAAGLDIIRDVLIDQEKVAEVEENGDSIELLVDGQHVATIEQPEKAEMLRDWNRKQRPALAVLLADGKSASLRFYCDDRKENAWREQSVVVLTSYKAEEKQDCIESLDGGDELELEEDFEKDGVVHVCWAGEAIGNLPSRVAKKYVAEGAFACYFENAEEDDSEALRPSVRIYW